MVTGGLLVADAVGSFLMKNKNFTVVTGGLLVADAVGSFLVKKQNKLHSGDWWLMQWDNFW